VGRIEIARHIYVFTSVEPDIRFLPGEGPEVVCSYNHIIRKAKAVDRPRHQQGYIERPDNIVFNPDILMIGGRPVRLGLERRTDGNHRLAPFAWRTRAGGRRAAVIKYIIADQQVADRAGFVPVIDIAFDQDSGSRCAEIVVFDNYLARGSYQDSPRPVAAT